MLDQKRIWDSIYKWLGDHKIVVSIYECKCTGHFEIWMTQDRGIYTVSVHTLIPDTEWWDIELDAFKFRAVMMDLYHRLQEQEVNHVK